ncbi:MAG: DUF6273 domain-containing protein [Clostridiales bacterium]|nr:DUF6273 domain-containing protein [Clostridiales bacterium]
MEHLHCWWWLRSPGNNTNNAANVNNDGDINNNGNNVNNSNDCVRPDLLPICLKCICKFKTSVPGGKGIGIHLAVKGRKTYVGGRRLRN